MLVIRVVSGVIHAHLVGSSGFVVECSASLRNLASTILNFRVEASTIWITYTYLIVFSQVWKTKTDRRLSHILIT